MISTEDYEQLSKKIKPDFGDILIARYASVGAVRYVEVKIKFLISYSCAIIKYNKTINGKYLFNYLQSNIIQYQIELNINTGSQRNIGIDSLKTFLIFLPKQAEQTKIGNYFQNLDKLIEQKEQKYKKLKQLKKAMLSKILPKDGEDTPEIRFKGFSAEWEEKNLGEIGNATSGTSIESEFLDRGKYKVVSIGSYSEQSTYTDQGIRANLSKKTQKRILNKDDLTMVLNDKTASGNILGRVLLIEDRDAFVYNQRTQRIEPYQDKYDSQFLYQLLNAPLIRHKIINKSQGNTQIYVNWSGIKELYYLIPQKTEQIKIGNYFQKLDKLIDLQHQELEKLKNIKKASLDKMFI